MGRRKAPLPRRPRTPAAASASASTLSSLLVADADPARADHQAAEVLKALDDRGFTARLEDVNALEAFCGTLPGQGYANLRRPLVSTRNLADLLPVTSVWPGLPGGTRRPSSPPQPCSSLWGRHHRRYTLLAQTSTTTTSATPSSSARPAPARARSSTS